MNYTPLFGRRRTANPARPVIDTSIDWKHGLRPAQLESRRPDGAGWQFAGGHPELTDEATEVGRTDELNLERDNDELRRQLNAAERHIAQLNVDCSDHLDHINELTDQLADAHAGSDQWKRSAAMFSDRNTYLREKMARIAAAVNGT